MTPDSRRAAGWYDDETDAALLRYWDGAKWSPHTAPRPPDASWGLPEHTVALFRDLTAGDVTAVPALTVTMPLRAPDEHTTVPLAPETDDVPPRRAHRWRVGGGR